MQYSDWLCSKNVQSEQSIYLMQYSDWLCSKIVQSEQNIYLMQYSDWLCSKIVQSEQTIYLIQFSDWLFFRGRVQINAQKFNGHQARTSKSYNQIELFSLKQ